jgi:pectate lyase
MNYHKRFISKRIILILTILTGIGAVYCPKITLAQADVCTAVGWATQNGGVTGGGSATATIATTYTQLKAAITTASVKVVHISGSIEIPSAGRISFQDQSGKTIIGLPGSQLYSNDLTQDNSGIIYVKRCSNIIFRNVKFIGPGAYDADGWDNMTIDNSTNIWIDHCEFHDGMDGNLDMKNMADYITVTWTKFSYEKAPIPDGPGGSDDHRFSDLIGSSDSETQSQGKLKITFQYCWWAEGCVERMPRVRFGQLHIVNNLYNSSVSKYCILAGWEADLLIENNAFIGVKTPIDITQGTFTGVTARNNLFVSTTGNQLGSGTSFTPPYSLTIADASVLNTATFKNCVGATLPAPPLTCPCNTALPVELFDFHLTTQQNNYLLHWSLVNPQTIDQIVVEMSTNGQDFIPVAELNPDAHEYLLSSEVEQKEEMFYVRLKFLKKNGAVDYTLIKKATVQKELYLYPNPAKDKINIHGLTQATLIIYTLEGKKINEAIVTESKSIDINHLAPGSYILMIADPFGNERKRMPFYKF